MLPDNELAEVIFDHICEHQAETVAELTDARILARCRYAVARARRHAFEKEASVVAFAALMFLVAPHFDDQPAIAKALSSGGRTADERMARLMQQTREEDWEAAAALPAPPEW